MALHEIASFRNGRVGRTLGGGEGGSCTNLRKTLGYTVVLTCCQLKVVGFRPIDVDGNSGCFTCVCSTPRLSIIISNNAVSRAHREPHCQAQLRGPREVKDTWDIRYDTNIVYLTCSEKLTCSQLSPPHGTNRTKT